MELLNKDARRRLRIFVSKSVLKGRGFSRAVKFSCQGTALAVPPNRNKHRALAPRNYRPLYNPIFLMYSATAGSTKRPSGLPAAAASRIAVEETG
jgi:hypothetical protein